MLQQSHLSRAESNSPFRTSVLKKLDSFHLPALEYQLSKSPLSWNSPPNSSGLTTLVHGRRRFYQTPNLANAALPVISEDSCQAPTKTLRPVLEERARLVRKALCRKSYAKTSSTPNRTCLRSSRLLYDRTAVKHNETQNDPTFESNVDQMRSQGNNLVPPKQAAASEPMLDIMHVPKSVMHKHYLSGSSTEKHQTEMSVETMKSISLHVPASEDAELKLFLVKCDRKRSNHEVLWMQLTCTLIKNLACRKPASSDDLFMCRCLQMALRATKIVQPHPCNEWLQNFSDRIIELIQDVEKCSVHTRIVRPHTRIRKLDVARAEALFSVDFWEKLSLWLQNSRPHLLDRLTQNIQTLN